MPSVPYNPVTTEKPTVSGTPNVSVETPAAAFGSTIATGMGQLGNALEKAGDELMTRAVEIQKERNEAMAREADAEFMIVAGKLHAEFNSLQGRNAPDALPAHQANLDNLRKSIGEKIPNSHARKLYDAQTTGFLGRTLFNAAGHAATESKKFALGAATARIEATKDAALWQPANEEQWKDDDEYIVNEVRQKGMIAGWGDDQINNQVSHEISAVWSNRIVGLSKTRPHVASDLLERNRDKIRGQDIEKVEEKVRQQLRTTGARNISDAVNQGWAPYMKPDEIHRAVGVEDALIRIVKQAQVDNLDLQFTIGDQGGRRTPEQQAALVRRGVSQTYNSDHMSGKAIDLIPIGPNGQPDYKDRAGMEKINAAMEAASQKLGIPLAAKSAGFARWDPAHYSLPKDYDVATAPKAKSEPLQARVDRAKQYATKISRDDTIMSDVTSERVQTDFYRQKKIQKETEDGYKQTVTDVLLSEKAPTIEEQLLTDPATAQAWESVSETQRGKWRKVLAQNAKADYPETEERYREYMHLRGMAGSENADDRAEFLEKDLVEEKLSRRWRTNLVNMQKALRKDAAGNPAVMQAMRQLVDAGIAPRYDRDKEGNLLFRGMLQEALDVHREETKGKKPTLEEIKQIGSRLIQEQGEPWLTSTIFPSIRFGTTQLFNTPVPADRLRVIKEQLRAKGITKTDEEIAIEYFRETYQKLHGKKK